LPYFQILHYSFNEYIMSTPFSALPCPFYPILAPSYQSMPFCPPSPAYARLRASQPTRLVDCPPRCARLPTQMAFFTPRRRTQMAFYDLDVTFFAYAHIWLFMTFSASYKFLSFPANKIFYDFSTCLSIFLATFSGLRLFPNSTFSLISQKKRQMRFSTCLPL
jgi:hypothetical protein